MYKSFLLICFVLSISLHSGCGGSGVSISGTITVNGDRLESAEIVFLPNDREESEHAGAVVTNGEYQIKNNLRMKEGQYQVQIRSYRNRGEKVWDGMGDGTRKTFVDGFQQFIPPRYNDASEMTAFLKNGWNVFDADLEIHNH